MSSILDSSLANEGASEVSWAQRQMQVLNEIKNEFEINKPLLGLNIGACMHVTKETANLMLTFKAGGANVCFMRFKPFVYKRRCCCILSRE